jgi:mRNA interferase RelE/StbE
VERYKVLIKPSARKELLAISTKKDRQRIVRKIESLADEPRPPGCEKLSGYDRYRIRQGKYRIIYGIEDKELVVLVIKIAHRRDVYRAL